MSEMLRKLDDPSIDQKKISSTDNFELVYLRHKYFRRSTNPSPKRLKEFEEMICVISDKIYYRNNIIFKVIGFEKDDLRNIGRVNTVSFISMGGLKENPKLMNKFISDHKNKYGKDSTPTDRDIFLRECYNLSKYLNQRLHEVARFCEIKAANIVTDKAKKFFFIGDAQKNPSDESLVMFPQSFGYKRITEVEFRRLAKDSNSQNKTSFLTKDGLLVRSVIKSINFNALDNFYDFHCENQSYLDPEEILIEKEDFLMEKNLTSNKKLSSKKKI